MNEDELKRMASQYAEEYPIINTHGVYAERNYDDDLINAYLAGYTACKEEMLAGSAESFGNYMGEILYSEMGSTARWKTMNEAQALCARLAWTAARADRAELVACVLEMAEEIVHINEDLPSQWRSKYVEHSALITRLRSEAEK